MIPLFKVATAPNAYRAVKKVLDSGYVGQGKKTDEFEVALQKEWNLPYPPIAVNSGTSALDLAYHLCGIGRGDVVISTPQTCMATNTPLALRRAHIVWADVDRFTGLISPYSVMKIRDKLGTKVKAIIAVDWAGRLCDYRTLKEIGVPIIQDAAHAHWATGQHGEPIHQVGGDYICFPGTTTILTKVGSKRISDIEVGDFVLTSSGEYNRVVSTQRNKYQGVWARINAGQTKIVATENHPIMVYREGVDSWISASSVRKGDSVYIATKICESCKNKLVPFYCHVCCDCFSLSDRSLLKREKVSVSKKKHNRKTSRNDHHYRDVAPWMQKYKESGFKVIPLIHALPDFIAVKDGKVVAVEVESATSVRISKENKYKALGDNQYDEVIWIRRPLKRQASRYTYKIVGHLARVPVCAVRVGPWSYKRDGIVRDKSVWTYNLTVEDDPTYFAKGVLVHNCWSFQAIKHLNTVDGGALFCPKVDVERAKLLRWFGLDRTQSAMFRCSQRVMEVGFKYQPNDVLCSIGLANIPIGRANVERARENAKYYSDCLDPFIYMEDTRVSLPPYETGCSYWLFTILVKNRDAFIKHMADLGVTCSPVHARNDLMPAFLKHYSSCDGSGLRYFSEQEVCIPVGWWVSNEDRVKIVKGIESWASA